VTVNRQCLCTREMVMRAADIKLTPMSAAAVDRAIETASETVQSTLNVQFGVELRTDKFDWPNYDRAVPWKLYLAGSQIADVSSVVPVLTTGGVVIPASAILWGPWNQSPPYRWLELDRSQSYSFGQGSTPQQDIKILALYGYWNKWNSAGKIVSAISDTTGTSVSVSDSSLVGVGDVITIDSERMLVQNKSWLDTGQNQVSGLTTAKTSDVALGVTDGTQYDVDEVLLLDSERVLITDVVGNSLIVKRAWDGTVIATHSGSDIYALRKLTVVRGFTGSTAATHLNNAILTVFRVPPIARDLSIAEAATQKELEIGGYVGSQGSGANEMAGLGEGLAEKWEEAMTAYGRQIRTIAI